MGTQLDKSLINCGRGCYLAWFFIMTKRMRASAPAPNRAEMGHSVLRPSAEARFARRAGLKTAATWMLLPLPVGELLAEGDFFEFAYAGAGDFGDEDKGVWNLPLRERFG
jgi:hypothetical protein